MMAYSETNIRDQVDRYHIADFLFPFGKDIQEVQ